MRAPTRFTRSSWATRSPARTPSGSALAVPVIHCSFSFEVEPVPGRAGADLAAVGVLDASLVARREDRQARRCAAAVVERVRACLALGKADEVAGPQLTLA